MDLQFSSPCLTQHSITFLRYFCRTSTLLSFFLVALQTCFRYFFRIQCLNLHGFFLWQPDGLRGIVFLILPHFNFKPIRIIFYVINICISITIFTGFLFLNSLLSVPKPHVGVPVCPVTHMQAGNPYGLLGKPITKVIAQKLLQL